jgi:hypothetical protein
MGEHFAWNIRIVAEAMGATSGGTWDALVATAFVQQEAPASGAWWHSVASHPKLPRGAFGVAGEPLGDMEQLLFGPADSPDGQQNLFGGLRRAMAKCGYRDLKEFQRVEVVVDPTG